MQEALPFPKPLELSPAHLLFGNALQLLLSDIATDTATKMAVQIKPRVRQTVQNTQYTYVVNRRELHLSLSSNAG